MKNLSILGDKIAVGGAALCTIHCFLLPILTAISPSFQSLALVNDDSFHVWVLMGIIPLSLLTLMMGCKAHKSFHYIVIGLIGLAILAFSSLWGHRLLGHYYEKYLTLAGSLIISFAHIRNYAHCIKSQCGIKHPVIN